MTEQISQIAAMFELGESESILDKLPPEAKKWAESLPWSQRRYVLSLCHLMCAATPEMQAEFLDDYTATGLVAKRLQDKNTQQRVQDYLTQFHLKLDLNESVLRSYIRQFYIHSAQDVSRQPELYLESALRLVLSSEERNNVFNYILGFELIKMMFKMSWLQHERLYQLQINQEEFLNTYIKPIQHAHRINAIVVPSPKSRFFDKRNYFVQKPVITEKKLIQLVIATFNTDLVTHFGFTIIRHLNSLVFDYEYIFEDEQEGVFK
ncbi:cobyrinic acid a,c-diamide synthase [Coleofasciculus sp. FACHB-SPT36]|uniref:cobyrinic acid a,c-diamide synthase n=1 Tax=Cyanophyceae TaxID=3028117 RepID=UPI00168A921B|nr:cobyrinic acid a,c-diamide synthase [Coleofasciculus sp. FACHB-SPT36]MBD2540099.1 cobyrinic acid a,c-diamide synthase [Coleofasciculus sp. FACHB-SPT36]